MPQQGDTRSPQDRLDGPAAKSVRAVPEASSRPNELPRGTTRSRLDRVAPGKSSRIVKVPIFILPQAHDPGRKSSEEWARNDRRDRSGRSDDIGPYVPARRANGLTRAGHAWP